MTGDRWPVATAVPAAGDWARKSGVQEGVVGVGERFQEKARRRGRINLVRVVQAFLGVTVLTAGTVIAGINPFWQWWYWTATIMVATVTLAEPFFTGPNAALLYGLGGFASGLTAAKEEVASLWAIFFALSATIIVSAIWSMLSPTSRFGIIGKVVATRLGRPLWLGVAAVSIELLRGVPERGMEPTVWITAGVILAIVLSAPDWYRVFDTAGSALEKAYVESAIDPNILHLTTGLRMTPGQLVTVRGRSTSQGLVVTNMAHKTGM